MGPPLRTFQGHPLPQTLCSPVQMCPPPELWNLFEFSVRKLRLGSQREPMGVAGQWLRKGAWRVAVDHALLRLQGSVGVEPPCGGTDGPFPRHGPTSAAPSVALDALRGGSPFPGVQVSRQGVATGCRSGIGRRGLIFCSNELCEDRATTLLKSILSAKENSRSLNKDTKRSRCCCRRLCEYFLAKVLSGHRGRLGKRDG